MEGLGGHVFVNVSGQSHRPYCMLEAQTLLSPTMHQVHDEALEIAAVEHTFDDTFVSEQGSRARGPRGGDSSSTSHELVMVCA